jgi:hypothetical protein
VLKGFLREHFSSAGRNFSGGDAGLTKDEVSAIEAAITSGELTQRRTQTTEDIAASPP